LTGFAQGFTQVHAQAHTLRRTLDGVSINDRFAQQRDRSLRLPLSNCSDRQIPDRGDAAWLIAEATKDLDHLTMDCRGRFEITSAKVDLGEVPQRHCAAAVVAQTLTNPDRLGQHLDRGVESRCFG
jgi:hypothetical protein